MFRLVDLLQTVATNHSEKETSVKKHKFSAQDLPLILEGRPADSIRI